MNKPRAFYTEWSKSERGKQIPHVNIYIWNLEICCWWNYLHVSNEDTDIESRLKEKSEGEEGEGEMNGESIMEAYTLTYLKQIAYGDFFVWPRELKLGLCNNLMCWERVRGGRKVQERGDICTPMANSCWCMTEMKPIL